MEKALTSCKNYKKEIISAPIFKVIEAIFELLTPFVMRYLVDEGINKVIIDSNDYWPIVIPCIIIFAFAIFGFGSTMVCQYLASFASEGFGKDLRTRIFKKIESFGLKEVEMLGHGNLVNILTNDVPKVQIVVSLTMRLLIRAPILVIGSLICAFFINWKIALIFLAIIPLVVFIYFLILKFSNRQFYKVQKQTDKISSKSNDSINGIRVIKAFNKEEEEINEYKILTSSYYKEVKKNAFLNGLINPLSLLIINIAIILVIYFSSNYVFSVTNNNFLITNGDVVALISYLNQILLALIVLCNLIVSFSKGFASNKRINELLNIEASIKNNIVDEKVDNNKNIPLIEFNDVAFSYENNEKYIVSDLNFKINKGESIGIIGGTGSGKTTIIKLMERFVDVSKGIVLYKGQNIKNYDLNLLHQEISLVNQKSVLFKGTIKDNLLMGNSNADINEINNALKDSDAYDFVYKYEDNIEHKVEEGGKNFSGGQKQRLSIARSLIKKSELLILDDSTSALDYLTDKKVRKNIKKIEKLATLIVSQRISTLRSCDKIIVLYHGTIVGIGKIDELLETCSVFKEIYESQVRSK